MSELTYAKLVKAYFDCRKHKRNTKNAIEFEFDLENNLRQLYDDLVSGNYKIGQSICFIVEQPKIREVWAANFRDRIVHHLVYNELYQRFFNRFIKDTYSCIPKRGNLNAIKTLEHYTRSITQNYTHKAYYLKADIKNFFVSIDKDILYQKVSKYIKNDEKWLQLLVKQIIFHDCKTNVCLKSTKNKFAKLPKEKSLWFSPSNKGLPIGNLTSQFFSNVYLNALDQYVKHKWKCKYYLRYVDDFIILDKNPQKLNKIHKDLTVFLKRELGLVLHQNKKEVNLVSRGIDFVGYVVKPNKIVLRQKILRHIFAILHQSRFKLINIEQDDLAPLKQSLNSYFGMLINLNSFGLRKFIVSGINCLFLISDLKLSKLKCNLVYKNSILV